MITVTYTDCGTEITEHFHAWKEAKARALQLAKLGCKHIRVIRPA